MTVILHGWKAPGQSAPVVVPPSQNVAFVGDSLTSLSYGPLHPYTWANGIAGGVLKPVANCGVASDTIQLVINRIDNDYTNASPGIAGLTNLGWVILRIGTNNFRGGQSISGTTQGQYATLMTKILTYANCCIVMAVPPVGDPGDTNGDGIPGVNAWLSSYCAANPTRLHFINDCVTVDDGTGNWATGYGSGDGIHFSNPASYQMGIDGGAALATLLSGYAYASPISTDPADVYPTQPQWNTHHLMSGTGGTNLIGAGQMPTGWSLASSGSGYTANSSIVTADGGDPNSTPWFRVAPTVLAGAGFIGFSAALSGAAITTSYPEALDIVIEIRFNSFDASKFTSLMSRVYGVSNEQLSPSNHLRMQLGTINRTIVSRTAVRRSGTRLSHASATLNFELTPAGAFSGSMGSFDIRCATVRG